MARILTAGNEFGSIEADGFTIAIGPLTTARTQRGGAISPQGNGGDYYFYNTANVGTFYNFEPAFPAGLNEVYIRMHVHPGSRTDGVGEVLRLTNPAGSIMLRCGMGDPGGGTSAGGPFYNAVYNNAGTQFASNTTFTYSNNEWHLLELHVKFGGSGAVLQMKMNGQLIIDWTGSLVGPAAETVFHGLLLYSGSIAGGVVNYRGYDNIAFNDLTGPTNNSWIGEGYVLPFRPVGNGATSQLVNSERSSVDNFKFVNRRREDNPVLFVGPTAPNDKDTYKISKPPSEFHGVNAIKMSANVVRHGTTITQSKLLLQPLAQVEIASANQAIPQGGDDFVTANFENNPNTGNAPFTIAELQVMETGIQFVA